MNIEKWQDITNLIKDKFEIEDEGEEELEDILDGKIEFIIFSGPLGRMRLEYITKPVILDKKTIGSKRIGSDTAVQYIYSDTEVANIFKAYKWNADSEMWEEMEKESLGGFSV